MAGRGWKFLLVALQLVGTWGMDRPAVDSGEADVVHPDSGDGSPPASAESAATSGGAGPATGMELDQAALDDVLLQAQMAWAGQHPPRTCVCGICRSALASSVVVTMGGIHLADSQAAE